MLFSEPHTAIWLQITKDAYGTITEEAETCFPCFIERETQIGFGGNNLVELGKGIIFTSVTSLAFDTGQQVKIDSETFVFKMVYKAEGLDGEFSHWELTYG